MKRWILMSALGGCQAIVYLATSHGLTPVIPFFTFNGMAYPVDSPTGLAGKAVAALFNYAPGYLHAWMPEEATEQERAKFSPLNRHGSIVFERWKVSAAKLPVENGKFFLEAEMRHLQLDKTSARRLREKLPYWTQLENLHLLADSEAEARRICQGGWNPFFPRDVITPHFGRLDMPLMERIQGFAVEAQAVYRKYHVEDVSSFFLSMNEWSIKHHSKVAFLPLVSPKVCHQILLKLLLKIGWKAFSEYGWEPAQMTAVGKVLQRHGVFYGPDIDIWGSIEIPWEESEIIMLANLRHERKPLVYSRYESLLGALHLEEGEARNQILRMAPTRPMLPETREYLRGLDLSAEILVRFGYYEVKEVDPEVLLPILSGQSQELIKADEAGYLALCTRLVPLIPDNYDLTGAPWVILYGMVQMNKRVTEAIIALLKLPKKDLSDRLWCAMTRVPLPANLDLPTILAHLEAGLLIGGSFKWLILCHLLSLDVEQVIRYACVEPNLKRKAQKRMMKVLQRWKVLSKPDLSRFSLRDWIWKCRPVFEDLFKEWNKQN